MEIEGVCGTKMVGDGDHSVLRMENYGALVTNDWSGKYATAIRRGYGFAYPTAQTGITFAALTTTNQYMIINPPGSNRVFIPLRVRAGYVSATNVAGHVAMYEFPVNSIIGTAASVVSYTAVAARPLSVGAGTQSKMIFTCATNVIVGTPTHIMPLFSTAAMIATTVAAPFQLDSGDLDGMVQFMPGQAMVIAANAAIAMVASVVVLGLELPLAPGF
jgi:hypothetical protein